MICDKMEPSYTGCLVTCDVISKTWFDMQKRMKNFITAYVLLCFAICGGFCIVISIWSSCMSSTLIRFQFIGFLFAGDILNCVVYVYAISIGNVKILRYKIEQVFQQISEISGDIGKSNQQWLECKQRCANVYVFMENLVIRNVGNTQVYRKCRK